MASYDHRPLGSVSLQPGSALQGGASSLRGGGGPSGSGAPPPPPSASGGGAAGHPLNGLVHPSHAQQQQQQQQGAPGGPGQPGGVVGVVSQPHPSAQRLNDLLEFVKAEFEQVAVEGGVLRAQREEYEAMIHNHASELNAMRAMTYDLERKYHDDKRLLQEANSALQEENSRLRQQLETARSSAAPGTSSLPGAPPSSSASALGRPTLPPIMPSGHGTPARPGSSGPAGFEREGGASGHPGGAAPYTNGRERDGSVAHEHPNKRLRTDEEERRKSSAAGHRYPGASDTLSRPPSTGPPGQSTPQPPTLHQPSPLPPNSLPPLASGLGSAAPSPAPPAAATSTAAGTPAPSLPPPVPAASGASSAAGGVKEEKPVEVTSFDPETAPKDLKKEGSDWMTMFNPNVKRVLDVGLVHTLVHDSVVCCVRFSPDGKILATGCNRNTTLYDTKTGAKIGVLFDASSGAKTDNYIRSVSFSPDGKFLATGSEDKVVRIWNLAQKRISAVLPGHKSEIYSLAFSPDGRRLVSGSGDKSARMWDLETGACVFALAIDDITIAENGPVDAGVTSVIFSPDGKLLAAGSLDTVVRIWDAETGQLLDKLKGHKDSVYSVAFSPDGKFLVSGSLDKTLKMFDVGSLKAALAAGGKDAPVGEGGKTTCLTTLQGHKDYVLSVDISPDGAWIVSGSKDRGVQFWDPKTAKAQFMLQGHKNSVISVAVSPVGGMVATGSGDWTSRIWSYERIAN